MEIFLLGFQVGLDAVLWAYVKPSVTMLVYKTIKIGFDLFKKYHRLQHFSGQTSSNMKTSNTTRQSILLFSEMSLSSFAMLTSYPIATTHLARLSNYFQG